MSRFNWKLLVVFVAILLLAGCGGSAGPGDGAGEPTADVAAGVSEAVFGCSAVSEIPAAECQALTAFYEAANGTGWKEQSGWLDSTTPCAWFGVSCEGGHVVSLALVDNNLGGQLPDALAGLTNLKTLDLHQNGIEGGIPAAFGSLSHLEKLDLSANRLSGAIPFELGEVAALAEIDLSFNQLTGSAPSALFEVPVFRFWGNKLDGTIFLAENGRQDVNFLGAIFSFDERVADSVWSELAPAQLDGSLPGLLWMPPEHIVFTFTHDDGPAGHMPLGQYLPAEAQIHIFPTAGLNAEVQPVVAGLKQLLSDRPDLAAFALPSPQTDAEQIGLTMLPPSNARQVLRAQLQYISFAEGMGVRYLTQLSQGPVPLSNQDVFYTFQGLTDNGATYVAAYFPVTVPALPATSELGEEALASLLEDWQGYLAGTLAMLNEQPSSAFTPDLGALDALVNSISVAGTTAVPTLEIIGPANEETVENQPVLAWQGYPDAASYQVVVLNDAAFPPEVMIDRRVTEPSLVVEESLAPGHYSWTVWAYDKDDKVLAELNSTFIVADEK